MKALLATGGPLDPRVRTLRELVPAFLSWFEFVRRRKENTIRSYREDFKVFLEFCDQAGLARPDEITFRHIEFYLGWLQTERHCKPQSANHHLHALRTLWQYLKREGLAATNPAMDCFMLPTQKKLPGYLTIPEQERLLTVLAENRSLPGRRDYALVATGLFAGLRCAELAALQLAHLDLEVGRLRVVNGKGGKDRELPIIPRLAAILRDYLAEVRPALVGRPVGSLERHENCSPVKELGKNLLGWKRGKPYWTVVRHINGRRVSGEVRAYSREEAERLRAESYPPPPDPEFVFVNASPTGSHRFRRAGLPILGRTIFHLMRRVVSPILGRPVAPHMLRHSFASRLREKGADLQLIQEALGHANINTTTMYAHLTTNRRRQELARLLE